MVAVRPACQTVAAAHAGYEVVGDVATTLAIQNHALCAGYLSVTPVDVCVYIETMSM